MASKDNDYFEDCLAYYQDLGEYFSEWQCRVCDETDFIDTILQENEIILYDLEGDPWVKCRDCDLKFHAHCILHVYSLELDVVEQQGYFSCCVHDD